MEQNPLSDPPNAKHTRIQRFCLAENKRGSCGTAGRKAMRDRTKDMMVKGSGGRGGKGSSWMVNIEYAWCCDP